MRLGAEIGGHWTGGNLARDCPMESETKDLQGPEARLELAVAGSAKPCFRDWIASPAPLGAMGDSTFRLKSSSLIFSYHSGDQCRLPEVHRGTEGARGHRPSLGGTEDQPRNDRPVLGHRAGDC